MQFHRDTRADATGILNFLLALVVGAVVTWIVKELTNPVLAKAGEVGTDSVATTTHGWLSTFITNLPLVFMFTSFFSLIALSVFQREVLR